MAGSQILVAAKGSRALRKQHGERIARFLLGFLITMGRSLGRTDVVLLGMCGVAAMGILIGVIIDKVEARLLAGIRR